MALLVLCVGAAVATAVMWATQRDTGSPSQAAAVADDPLGGAVIRRVAPTVAPTSAAAPMPVSDVVATAAPSVAAPTSVADVAGTAPPTMAVPTTTAVPATTLVPADGRTAAERTLELVTVIGGDIAPKSIVHSGHGRFIAQNMMYRHTVTVYDRTLAHVATIPDSVDLSQHGFADSPGSWQGSPVEAAFTGDGRYAYVSNYQMFGPGYDNAGGDGCDAGGWDDSFVYRLDLDAARIDQVIPVGAVPKYVSVTPDDRLVLVTNWCSFDMSVIDTATAAEVARIPLGRHPRGIAVTSDSATAYVAVMGSQDVAVVDLAGMTVSWISGMGISPRHLVLDSEDRYLYASLNGEGTVAKVDLATAAVVAKVATGAAPRSMAISDDGSALYVVNYTANTVSKVRTADMAEVQEVAGAGKPIGITYDAAARQVWVANYGGSIQVFADR